MPVATRSTPPRQIVYLLVATLLGIVAMVFLVTRTADLARSGDVQLNIGDEVFAPGNVDRLSDDIASLGPLLFSDPSGRDRDIVLQHLGDEDAEGWFAFAARPADAPRDCFVVWDDADAAFDYTCGDVTTTYPADGAGLFQYPVAIDADGDLSVDLNAADRRAETEAGDDESDG